VVITTVVGEVHHGLHHNRIEPLVPLGMGYSADGCGLHLQTQRLAHRLGDETPGLLVLDDLIAAAHRCNMNLEGQHRSR